MGKIVCLAICLLLIAVSPTWAHRMNVFAWLEDDNIVVRCNFGSNRPAQNVEVKVFEAANHLLLAHGTTNKQGEVAFPRTVRMQSGLLIEADAGQGHKSEWKMEASELDPGPTQPAAQEEQDPSGLRTTLASANPASDVCGINREDLKAILTESLAPINRQLADMHSDKPGITEIIGGIGWIMGFAGITFYFMSRKKK